MRPLLVLLGLLLALTAPFGLAASPAAATTEDVEVTFDRSEVSTVLGGRFTLQTTIVNSGGAQTDPILAHLNVASLTSDVYVDPEDWSADRSKEVAPLRPGQSTSLSWDIQAVNAGSFDVYVVLLPNGPSTAGEGPLVVSPPVHLKVAGRRTLSPGGVMPVVIVVPVLLGLVAAAARFRLRGTG